MCLSDPRDNLFHRNKNTCLSSYLKFTAQNWHWHVQKGFMRVKGHHQSAEDCSTGPGNVGPVRGRQPPVTHTTALLVSAVCVVVGN